jgi:outer membrane protein OmpA-like peptidoglycan-associated protein
MAQHGNHHYAHSMIDMMTSLAVLFILISAAIMQSAAKDKQRAKIEANKTELTEKATRDLRDKLVESLTLYFKQGAGLKVNPDPEDPNLLSIAIEDQALQFKKGKFELSQESHSLTRKLAGALTVISKDPAFEKNLEYVVVEGHTSADGGLRKNVELSQQRSFAVLQQIISDLEGKLAKDEVESVTRFLSSTGHWWNRPLDERNKMDEKNQRVEIRIRIKSQMPISAEIK